MLGGHEKECKILKAYGVEHGKELILGKKDYSLRRYTSVGRDVLRDVRRENQK